VWGQQPQQQQLSSLPKQDLPLPSPPALGSPRVCAYLVLLPAAPQNHIENRNENGGRDQNAAPQDVAGAAVATDMRKKEEFESSAFLSVVSRSISVFVFFFLAGRG
jgi:hypothetical protein